MKQCISQSQVIRLCPLFSIIGKVFIKEMEFKAVIELISMRILKYFEKGIQSCHETNNFSFKVSSRLFKIQRAFISLLGDNNDLVQDAASKGVAIVYEACKEEQRDGMVNNLLDTLLGRKSQEVKKVNEDTKVFEEGELGKNPTGGNMSTYKELCSLATDMGQPDLVYKFMHLANHNATWNSKKGAAFGFSTIASKAGDQLEPHLPKIIPKLFRYCHDPTPRIRQVNRELSLSNIIQRTSVIVFSLLLMR